MDKSLSKLWEIQNREGQEAWWAVVDRVTKSQTQLNNWTTKTIITQEIQRYWSALVHEFGAGTECLKFWKENWVRMMFISFLVASILPTPYRCSTRTWERNQSDSGTQNVIKKLRLSKPVGGQTSCFLPEILMEGRRGERKTDRDRQDDQRDRKTERQRDQRDSSGT